MITQFLLARATPAGVASTGARTQLAAAMRAFDRMYEPHEAREDTAMVARVAGIEQALGIYDLSQFTPQVSQYSPQA